jgi:hypothetical protein
MPEIAKNVDERGVLKIRSIVAKYGLKETLEAVFLEVCDTLDGNEGDPDYEEAKRVRDRLDEIIGRGQNNDPAGSESSLN